MHLLNKTKNKVNGTDQNFQAQADWAISGIDIQLWFLFLIGLYQNCFIGPVIAP